MGLDLSIIIINYNTRDILKDCLKNLENININLKYEIIVVDNGSTDGSYEMVEFIAKKNSTVKAIKSINNGLAVGSNLGLKESKGKYLLYLGSDAFPKNGTIEGMIKYLDENKDVGIATCKLILRNGKLDMDAHRGFPTPIASITHFTKLNKLFPKSKIFNKYFIGWEDMNKPHEIDLCISHFMMIKKEVFEKIGAWDEDFFVFGEDVDFCYRSKQAGFKIMYLSNFEAIHFKGSSVGIRKESRDITKATNSTKSKMNKETTRAMKLFYNKHYSQRYPKFFTNMIFLAISILEKVRSKL